MNECGILDSTYLCDRNKCQTQLSSATEITSSPFSRGETCLGHTRNGTFSVPGPLICCPLNTCVIPPVYMLWHNQYEHSRSCSCWHRCCTHSAEERQTWPRHSWGGLSPVTLSGGPDSIPVRSCLIHNGQSDTGTGHRVQMDRCTRGWRGPKKNWKIKEINGS
jgi:hypothetical protein